MKIGFKSKIVIGILIIAAIADAIYFWPFSASVPTLHFESHADLTQLSTNEFNALLEIHRGCFEETRRKQLALFFARQSGKSPLLEKARADTAIANSRLTYRDDLRKTKNVFIAKDEDGGPIGLFNCREDNEITDHSVMVFNVCLKKDMRGKGLGNVLMHHAIEHCRQPGRDLSLTVYQDDAYVLDFYRKLNFHTHPMSADHQKDFQFFNKVLMIYNPDLPQEVSPAATQ